MTDRRYYDPGKNPAPRKPVAPAKSLIQTSGKARKSRRIPRARRIALCAQFGVPYSGRQWRMLRKRMRLRERKHVT